MIVAFSGSHSTGKSTLLEYFRANDRYICIDSVTRKTISPEERKVDGVDNLNRAQLNILNGIEEAMRNVVKLSNENPDKVILLDRCVFDFLAYTRCFNRKGLVSDRCLRRIERQCEMIINEIDLVAYLGIEFGIVDDGVRSLDETLRKEVDAEIQRELMWYKVRAIQLKGTVDERIADLQAALHTLGYKEGM